MATNKRTAISTEMAFDLNIGKVLEHWTVPFAVREVIANAVDEQALTGTTEPIISKSSGGRWHVADAGRGLRYEHLAQNESAEKRRHPDVIGQFGMGLKDALAVFDWHASSIPQAPTRAANPAMQPLSTGISFLSSPLPRPWYIRSTP